MTLSLPEHPAARLALRVASLLRSHTFQAWLVGGCVRDLLLGRDPKDYDVATDATPDRVLALFPRAQLVGAKFGVVLVAEDGHSVEVATFRSEGDYRDGRHPGRVSFETEPRNDVLRRDFTINALLLNPETGELLDHVNGRADLEKGIIRAIGDPDIRFAEDHLRMLRAVRFAARFDFTIEPGTLHSIQRLHAGIMDISAERIREELVRILTEGHARRGMELLDESGLLEDILPEVARMKGVQQPPEFHPEGDVWVHTLMMLDGLRQPTPTLAMGVLLHDVGKPPTFRIADRIRFDGHVEKGEELAAAILSRLRFSLKDTGQILALIANHMKFKDVPHMRESTRKRFLRMPEFAEHLELHRLDVLSSNKNLTTYHAIEEQLRNSEPEHLKPPRLLTGADLIALGYRPGPEFSIMLSALEDAQLEGRIATREEALSFLKDSYPASPSSPLETS